jgi:hypothetical protein
MFRWAAEKCAEAVLGRPIRPRVSVLRYSSISEPAKDGNAPDGSASDGAVDAGVSVIPAPPTIPNWLRSPCTTSVPGSCKSIICVRSRWAK